MIKYRVIHADGFTEFRNQEDAEILRDAVQGEIVELEIEQPQTNPNVPHRVSAVQLRLSLCQSNHINQVKQAISTATEEEQQLWEYSQSYERYDDRVISVLSSAGLSTEDIDDVFMAARGL